MLFLCSVSWLLCPRPLGGALSDDAVWRLSVCLSVAYIGPKPRTERPRKTKIGTEVAHVVRDSDTTFKVKRSKVNLQGVGAYCGGLLHSLLLLLLPYASRVMTPANLSAVYKRRRPPSNLDRKHCYVFHCLNLAGHTVKPCLYGRVHSDSERRGSGSSETADISRKVETRLSCGGIVDQQGINHGCWLPFLPLLTASVCAIANVLVEKVVHITISFIQTTRHCFPQLHTAIISGINMQYRDVSRLQLAKITAVQEKRAANLIRYWQSWPGSWTPSNNAADSVDCLLFLHLERNSMDWQGALYCLLCCYLHYRSKTTGNYLSVFLMLVT